MLIEGQVLWLKFRFNNQPGEVSSDRHPYIITDIDLSLNAVELIQCDSIDEKSLFKAYLDQNAYISKDSETVFAKNGIAQLDNCFKVEHGQYLEQYKETEDTVTKSVYEELKRKYISYQLRHDIADNKTVYMSKSEVLRYNPED